MKDPMRAGTRRALPLAALMLFLPLTLYAAEAEADLRELQVGSVLPSRQLKSLDGRPVVLPAPKGVTVVVFWSTWSPRSAPSLSLWEEMAREYGSHPLTVLTVNAEHQKMEAVDLAKVSEFIKANNLTLPTVLDDNLDLYNEIGVIALPTTLFFKEDGTLAAVHSGFPSSAKLDLREELEKQLGIAPPEEAKAHRGELAYQPKNNALLYYSMGMNLRKIGMRERAREKFIEAIKRDPEYADPVKALEDDFFHQGRSSQAEGLLMKYLEDHELPGLASKYRSAQ